MSDGLKSQCKKCHSECALRTRDRDKANASKRASEATRRARKAKAICKVKKTDYENLSKILGSNCLCCGSSENIQWDHVVPLAKGGEHSVNNLQPLCRKCNEKKQANIADYRTGQQKVWVIKFELVEIS